MAESPYLYDRMPKRMRAKVDKQAKRHDMQPWDYCEAIRDEPFLRTEERIDVIWPFEADNAAADFSRSAGVPPRRTGIGFLSVRLEPRTLQQWVDGGITEFTIKRPRFGDVPSEQVRVQVDLAEFRTKTTIRVVCNPIACALTGVHGHEVTAKVG